MNFEVTHITKYDYENTVTFCHNRAMMNPREIAEQKLINFNFEVNPEIYESTEYKDFFGNNIINFLVQKPHNSLIVKSIFKVERDSSKIMERIDSKYCKSVTLKEGLEILKTTGSVMLEWTAYTLESKFVPLANDEMQKYVQASFTESRSIFDAAKEFTERIFKDFKFMSGCTNIVTPVEEIFREREGVCQDFTHVAVSCIRSLGLPARYVSGYIETIPPEGKEKLTGVDASHALFGVYIPSFGWVDFDPTNNLIPSDQHITVGWGRDYSDITPLRGVIYSSGENLMSVTVDVKRY